MELTFRKQLMGAVLILAVVFAVEGKELKARCDVKSNSGTGPVSGTIELTQTDNGNVSLSIDLNNLPSGLHGFHVHAVSSLGNSCMAAGGHLNNDNTLHGGPLDPKDKRHTGDLGNIVVPAGGSVIKTVISDWLIKLDGANSVIGKPIVIHSDEDDLGKGTWPDSNTTGHAGARLGCCIITSAAPSVLATISTLLISCLAAFIIRTTLSQ